MARWSPFKVMLKNVRVGELHFFYKFGDVKFYKKVRSKVLQAMAYLWSQI